VHPIPADGDPRRFGASGTLELLHGEYHLATPPDECTGPDGKGQHNVLCMLLHRQCLPDYKLGERGHHGRLLPPANTGKLITTGGRIAFVDLIDAVVGCLEEDKTGHETRKLSNRSRDTQVCGPCNPRQRTSGSPMHPVADCLPCHDLTSKGHPDGDLYAIGTVCLRLFQRR
jgi:hypothetical protein